nr:dehydrogenase [Prevotella sp.]
MADNFLEKKRASYEEKKEVWLKKKKHITSKRIINRPEDESL